MRIPFSKEIFSVGFVCILFHPGLPVQASVPDISNTITLKQAVHFIGTDGNDVVANPGDYFVEAAEVWLRLVPGIERRDALLIEAKADSHELKIDIPLVLSTPGSELEESLDVYVVELLNPDGTSMVALGTYSGIRPRGLFTKLRNKIRNGRIGKGARRLGQAGRALLAKPQEARVETSTRVPPTPIKIGETITFGDASGYRRKICQWIGGHLIKANEWGCQSHIDLANGHIQVKADKHGTGLRVGGNAEAWVEIFKDITVVPPPGSVQEQSKDAIFNVPIRYHGKAISTQPFLATGHYKILLSFDEVSFAAGPAYNTIHLEKRLLEDETVKAAVKMVKGIPVPTPDVDMTTQKNPVYFNAPVIPGRSYRLTLRVEIEAKGAIANWGFAGSSVNFMDKALILNERQRVDGFITWDGVTIRINP